MVWRKMLIEGFFSFCKGIDEGIYSLTALRMKIVNSDWRNQLGALKLRHCNLNYQGIKSWSQV